MKAARRGAPSAQETANTNGAEREAAAEWLPLDLLRPWVKNPRKNDEAAQRVAESIRRFGFGSVILARRENHEVIAGHTRLKACLILAKRWKGMSKAERSEASSSEDPHRSWHPEAVRVVERREVPVRLLDHDEAEAHLLAIADNRSSEWAQWDEPLVYEILDGCDVETIDMVGFDPKDFASGFENVQPLDEDDAFGSLPNGEKGSFQKMSFILQDSQAETVKAAIQAAKDAGPFDVTLNQNSNANALARICEAYLGSG